MRRSIDRIMGFGPSRVFPAHFGELRDPATAADDLRRMIDWHVRAAVDANGEIGGIRERLAEGFEGERAAQMWPFPNSEVRARLAPVIGMNAQGLAVWHDKHAKSHGGTRE
jgi:hypothetical protein